jgi:hypothetical protein
MFGPLQDNGGATQTVGLLPSSPAVDAGDNSYAPATDQRGLPRIVGGTIDLGALEVQPGPATRFQVSAAADATAGMPFDITVTALDAFGHTAVGYQGTVTFSSTDSDSNVLLPPDYIFQSSDDGTHTFTVGVTLITLGNQAVTATDRASGIGGNVAISVRTPTGPPGGDASGGLMPSTKVDLVQEITLLDRFFGSLAAGTVPSTG